MCRVFFKNCKWLCVKDSSHPENVIDEQPPQQDAAGTDVVQVEQLHAIQGEGQAKQVIGYPVLWRHRNGKTVPSHILCKVTVTLIWCQ